MAFMIAHDFENSKTAHMTGTGIVFIEYIGSMFEPHKFALSARDSTLHNIFSGRMVTDPFNPAKVHEGEPIYFEDHLQAEKYYESMKYVLREYEAPKGEIGDLLDKPKVYTETQIVEKVTLIDNAIGEFTPVQNIVDDPCTLLLLMVAIASVFFILMDIVELIHFSKEQETNLVFIKIIAIVSSVIMACLSLIALMKLTGC